MSRGDRRIALDGLKGAPDPGRRRGRRSRATTARPRTRRRTSCCSTSALATVSIVVLIAFAIGWREALVVAGRDPDHDPAHAVCRAADGLHDQPRQPVRADLLHRHPGRRRHRGGREHRPPLGDARRPRRACRRRSRRWPRSAIPTIVATLTVVAALLPMLFVSGTDGALHGADPGQRLGGDAVLVLRRHDGGAVADAAAGAGSSGAAGGSAWRARRRRARPRSTAASPRRAASTRPRLDVPARGRRRHHRSPAAVLHQGGHGEAAAVRQQVGAAGRASTCPKARASRTPTHAVRRRRPSLADLPEVASVQAYAGTAAPFNFNGLVRHYYLRADARAGRSADQPRAEGDARAREPRHRARSARSG